MAKTNFLGSKVDGPKGSDWPVSTVIGHNCAAVTPSGTQIVGDLVANSLGLYVQGTQRSGFKTLATRVPLVKWDDVVSIELDVMAPAAVTVKTADELKSFRTGLAAVELRNVLSPYIMAIEKRAV